jgi:hypothetical protein
MAGETRVAGAAHLDAELRVVRGEDFKRRRIMLEVEKGADRVTTPARDAVEWFVENGSDRELNEATVLQWEEWCTHVWNNAAYAGLVHMCLQIPLLSAPIIANREDLRRDVLAEDGHEF